MSQYPQMTLEYIEKMPKSEYFMRLSAYELQMARNRLESASINLDKRTMDNDTEQIGEGQIRFNITHPYQLIDYPYYESVVLGKDAKRSDESKTNAELLKEERERFEKIKREVEQEFSEREGLNNGN